MGSRNKVGVIRVQPRSPLATLEVPQLEPARPFGEQRPGASLGVEKRAIQWFQSNFSRACKRGCMTLKDFKRAAREIEGFSENLFELFDTDHSGSVTLQELVGGMSKLASRDSHKKILKWFEQQFAGVSGDDHLLQLYEFRKALQINGFSERFFQLIDIDGSGKVTFEELMRSLDKLTCLDRDAKWLAWFEQHFSMVAGADRQIGIGDFKKALHVKESFFAERFFTLFDKDNNGTISLQELMGGLGLLTCGSEMDKLRFLFEVYDVNGNGFIEPLELKDVLKSCMDESRLKFSDDKLEELTEALFQDADTDGSGTISFDELKVELDKHPGVLENLTISAANWLRPPPPRKPRTFSSYVPHQLTWKYIRNNLRLVFTIIAYLFVNTALFIYNALSYKDLGVAVMIARGCGMCLNFNCTFILVLMLRKCLTWLRSTPMGPNLPLDHNIELHKIIGIFIAIFGGVHTAAHYVNLAVITSQPNATYEWWEYAFTARTDLGWVSGTAGITGFLLFLMILTMVSCSQPAIRRNGFFEVFYYTHMLYWIFYIVMILHAQHFWKWFLVPGIIYILERILRSQFVKLARYGHTYILEGILLPSKVVHLVISRPHGFNFQPGDYCFVQIPSIASYEWHPFTISSCPEQEDVIWFHIRCVGTWTNRLYKLFEERNTAHPKIAINLNLPKEHVPPKISIKARPQTSSTTISFGSDLLELEDETHPLSPQMPSLLSPLAATCRTRPCSVASQGQDFSHMFREPAIINVDVDPAEDEDISRRVEIYLDGPYGSPSAHIFNAEHAVLIGAGIGVTPFASILQSIVTRYRNAKHRCPKCNYAFSGDIPSTVMRLRKVDFYWINRDQESFEWFVSLLSQLEIEQLEQGGTFDRFLELHMHMTSALKKTDMKAIGLQMALDLIHKKDKRDLITGLKTRTEAGRPDWNKVFEKIDRDKKGRVTVFFCGAPALGLILKTKCDQFGFEFRKENF
ncbi:NADPH oxidase 5-like [Corticium candelabrum]|uniref:NADPH oxidase 5-like n=1 Tax=Corticium candelabrum TaxID=121492 RepID=UPI002E25FC32|nr:NADPH oxidase 5-like [Corticium candelabrum]